MITVENILHQFFYLGVEPHFDYEQKRQISFANRISFYVIFLSIFSYLAIIVYASYTSLPISKSDNINILITGLLACLVPVFNRYHRYLLSKIILSITPFFGLTILPILTDQIFNHYIFITPILIISISTIPHFIFSLKSEIVYFYVFIVFNFLFLIFAEKVYEFFHGESMIAFEQKKTWMFFIKLTEIIAFISAHVIIGYFLYLSKKYHSDLERTIEEIDKKNKIDLDQKESLESQNLKLEKYQKNLSMHNEELLLLGEHLSRQNQESMQLLDQLKITQVKLIESEKMATLGQLAAGIAHEVNNPLNFIHSGLMGLEEGLNRLLKIAGEYEDQLKSSEDHFNQIEFIQKQQMFGQTLELVSKVPANIAIGVKRALDVIKELKSFETGTDEIYEKVNVNELLDSCLVLLFNRYKNEIRVIKSYQNVPKIECIYGRVHQVFINLLSNAIDAIFEKIDRQESKLEITTQLSNDKRDHVIVKIKDNGTGIMPEMQPLIFDPFYTTKPAGKGMGLGLSIATQIIQKHGGSIEFESVTGRGTEFSVLLPVKQSK